MARRPQTFAKRMREMELKERRELKRAKKASRRSEFVSDPVVVEVREINASDSEDESVSAASWRSQGASLLLPAARRSVT